MSIRNDTRLGINEKGEKSKSADQGLISLGTALAWLKPRMKS